ncbi:hypothetical protein FSC37_11025 [Piscinibacter aquaticus]|uniref:Uncharacterized protein n=1 Tax=Piscinibacter aquaticus TaxID=392597 RepID=A0A5C6U0H0_9BURK|nr:hypothetical protein FSC37_11025 [Piscinibacter aquaticus]
MSMSSSASRPVAAGGTSGLIEFFRHHGAWAPGVKLFRRIQFRAKAAIILAVLVVPLVVLGWNYFGDRAAAIEFTAKELRGAEYAREVLPLITHAQRQRELAAAAQSKGRMRRHWGPRTKPTTHSCASSSSSTRASVWNWAPTSC